MLVGRQAELARLDRLVEDLEDGRGGALLVRGDPGIGKTALLEALRDRAAAAGILVLAARGVESEAELAFSALADLLTPLQDELHRLPAPQASALAAALALGPAEPGERLAVCVATAGLLGLAATERPVLALVDDLQWVDSSSRECVLFAARRGGGGVLLVVAAREPVAVAGGTGLQELTLGPLDEGSSLRLVERSAADLRPDVAAAVAGAAAGNPLALLELAAVLAPDERAGRVRLQEPLAPGPRLADAYGRRIAALGQAARRALLVAAAYEGDELRVIGAACRAAGVDPARLSGPEREGLVRIIDGRLAFAHPLVRGAVYHGAAPEGRREAHRALAGALTGERRAWHLGAGAIGPDDAAAAELEAAAAAAAARRGMGPAAAALERAARLSSAPDAFARRLLAAGEASIAAGRKARALELLEEVVAAAGDDEALCARAEHARAAVLTWSGRVGLATDLLVEWADRIVGTQPVHAATMLADAAIASSALADAPRTLALAERAVSALGDAGDPSARGRVLSALAFALQLQGHARRAAPVTREADLSAAATDPLAPGAQWHNVLLRARLAGGELEPVGARCHDLARRAREAGALWTLAGAVTVAADVAYRLGDWDAADAGYAEGLAAARDSDQPVWQGLALTGRARLDAARGRESAGRAAVDAARAIAESPGIPAGRRFVYSALGFLELSLNRVSEAIEALETVERDVARSGIVDQVILPWGPDLVEAHVRAGGADDARRVLAVLERVARRAGTAIVGAPAARARGLVEEPFDAHFARALRLHDARPMPFERARTLLAYGRRLHRTRRRAEARERLREALAAFERLGAPPWAAQAQAELRAAGARHRRPRDDALTPQEHRVALAAARGATNREIAAELYLAPKTVEFHLGNVYRKLGVRSRTELAAANLPPA
jgi:DNA-binding CsgD family transcriptional regulator